MTDISRSARVRELLVALSEQLEDGEVEKLVLTQRKPRPRGGRSVERWSQLERELAERD